MQSRYKMLCREGYEGQPTLQGFPVLLTLFLVQAIPLVRRHHQCPAAGQDQVDVTENILHALGVMFDPAGMEEHGGLGRAPELGGLFDARGGDARPAVRPRLERA